MANEKRLIDANVLGIGRCNPDLLPFGSRPYAAGWNGVVNIIDNAPTVDAVEVIRCKDCKYRKEPENRFCNPYCTKHLSMQSKDDDFCSCGERRGNG